jgi:hemerythrin-like domain-containing protein
MRAGVLGREVFVADAIYRHWDAFDDDIERDAWRDIRDRRYVVPCARVVRGRVLLRRAALRFEREPRVGDGPCNVVSVLGGGGRGGFVTGVTFVVSNLREGSPANGRERRMDKGPGDLLDELIGDHRSFARAFDELQAMLHDAAGAPAVAFAVVERRVAALVEDLDRHARREEDHLFGLLVRRGVPLAELTRWLEEHDAIREAAERLVFNVAQAVGSGVEGDPLLTALSELRELFSAHAQGEETKVFALARRVLSPEDLAARVRFPKGTAPEPPESSL